MTQGTTVFGLSIDSSIGSVGLSIGLSVGLSVGKPQSSLMFHGVRSAGFLLVRPPASGRNTLTPRLKQAHRVNKTA